MLSTQGTIQFSGYTDLYDIVVPQDHKLRKLNSLCENFDFIYEELKDKYCLDNGLIKLKEIIMDSTHTCSRANAQVPVNVLQQTSKQLRKAFYGLDKDAKKNMPEKYEGTDLEKEVTYIEALVEHVFKPPVALFACNMRRILRMMQERDKKGGLNLAKISVLPNNNPLRIEYSSETEKCASVMRIVKSQRIIKPTAFSAPSNFEVFCKLN